MKVTVSDVMRKTRNYFLSTTFSGTFTVTDGVLAMNPALKAESWIAIEGGESLNGVHQLDAQGRIPGAQDGSWTGLVHLLSPTADFLRLCQDISDWTEKHPDVTLVSEKFGEYSRSQSSGAWERVFENRLLPYQRMFSEVNC